MDVYLFVDMFSAPYFVFMDNLLKFVVKYTTSVREVKCVNCQKHIEVIAALWVMHCYLVLGTEIHKMLV